MNNAQSGVVVHTNWYQNWYQLALLLCTRPLLREPQPSPIFSNLENPSLSCGVNLYGSQLSDSRCSLLFAGAISN
jgi:hypothetical protein